MLVNQNDIERFKGQIKIPQIGGIELDGFAEVTISKSTGVAFILNTTFEGKFYTFEVGAILNDGSMSDKIEYADNDEKTFFEAVTYFEKLIAERSPKTKEEQPSYGKFYFFKEKTGLDCYVIDIAGNNIPIAREDIPLVFSPPQTKKYGRLNMTEVQKPEYEIISSKFALSYNQFECEAYNTTNNTSLDLSDFAIYNITPYSNEQQNGQDTNPPPPDVNDEPLNPEDIEDEDLKPEEPEEPQDEQPQPSGPTNQSGPSGQSGQSGQTNQTGPSGQSGQTNQTGPSGQSGDTGGSMPSGPSGQSGQTNQTGPSGQSGQSGQTNQTGQSGQSGQSGQTNQTGTSGQTGQTMPSGRTGPSGQTGPTGQTYVTGPSGQTGQTGFTYVTGTSGHTGHTGATGFTYTPNPNFVPSLADIFTNQPQEEGIVEMFRTQKNLLGSLDVQSLSELKSEFYNKLNIPNNTTKEQFMEIVKQQTNRIF